MRVSSLLVVLSLFALPLAGCGNTDRDYEVAVRWVINGMVPSPEVCAEHGIARARFEVWNQSGKKLQTLESPCADLIVASDEYEYGGFVTTPAFEWDRRYDFALTLVAADGTAVSSTVQNWFFGEYGEPFVELPYLDYVNPTGTTASLTGEWALADRNGQPATCAQFGIEKVELIVASALDPEFEQSFILGDPVPCSNEPFGTFRLATRTLAAGNYQFYYRAMSAGDVEVARSTPITLIVDRDPAILSPRQTLQIR